MSELAPGLAALVLCGLVPVVTTALLAPQFAEVAPRVRNYRGRSAYLGLGAAWAAWAVGVLLTRALVASALGEVPAWLETLGGSAPVVLGACALGAFDDAAGQAELAKGFRGHARALLAGRMTLGALKMLGIGTLALVAALSLAGRARASAAWLAGVLARALAVALAANAANLLDVRPVRASKGYALALGALCVGALAGGWVSWGGAGVALTCALSLAPVVATWRPDAREQGMLGDAGANAMGAHLGYLAASVMPLPALALLDAALLALNLASERVSLSDVIARSRALCWLDALGRPKE